jgi:arginine/lysine/ornithine decarboxylase
MSMSVHLAAPPAKPGAPVPAEAPAAHPAEAAAAPLVEALERYRAAGTVPFSGPGHKLGAGVSPELVDLLGPELFKADVWLDTGTYDRTLRAAEALAAATWGSDRCWFLGNGSSSGNHAFLVAALSPGDEVIVGRDLHKSMLAALILTGARPVYVAPRLHPTLGVGLGVHPDDLAVALKAHPAAKLITLVSPTYFGVAADLPAIARVAHAHGVPVHVDQAWGPHLGFHPELPPSAMAAGADAAVTSTHKLLSSLSQSSILNLRGGRVDPARVASAVGLTQTTSPLLPLLASIDACRRQMALNGQALLGRTLDLAASARRRLQRLGGLQVLDADRLGLGPERFDPTRLVVDVTGLGLTGLVAERLLRQRLGIAPEGADLSSVVCMVTIGDTRASVDRLVDAFVSLSAGATAVPPRMRQRPRSSGSVIAPGPQAMTPREAFFAGSRAVPLAEAAGQVAAELVTPYPPGIPVLAPGEIATAEKLAYLALGRMQGMHVCGPADASLATLRVVARDRSEPPWTS